MMKFEAYPDGTIDLKFDSRSRKDCRDVLAVVFGCLETEIGLAAASEDFKSHVMGASTLIEQRNLRLMAEYRRRGLSVDKFAQEIAAENKAEKDRKRRWGTGTTVASTLAKQVRRLKKYPLSYWEKF
jgi:hypothetical protein